MADSAEPWFWTRRFTTTLALPTRFLSRNKNLLNPPVLFIIIIHHSPFAKIFVWFYYFFGKNYLQYSITLHFATGKLQIERLQNNVAPKKRGTLLI